MGLFSGCLFACDIDGTLMINGVINPRNIERVKFFTDEGGHFSISTGRSVGAVAPVLDKIKHISPSVVANGCMIYDYESKKIVEQLFLPAEDYRLAKMVLDSGLDVGIEVHSGEKVMTLHENEETRDHQKYEWLESVSVSFEEAVRYRWNKAVYLSGSQRDFEEIKRMLTEEPSGSDFSVTSAVLYGRKRVYYEQFPKGVSKASALDRLCKILEVKKGGFFAMGDYYNDIEMIKKADISAVPAGAPQEVAACADFRAGKCEDGAVADFIDYLTELKRGMV